MGKQTVQSEQHAGAKHQTQIGSGFAGQLMSGPNSRLGRDIYQSTDRLKINEKVIYIVANSIGARKN